MKKKDDGLAAIQNTRGLSTTSRRIERISRRIFDRKAVSNTVSATILTGAVIALSLTVFGWSEGRSADYSKEFGETVDAETARLKEKLVFEYVAYGNPSNNVTVYLLNCGTIDNVEIKSVYVSNSTWLQTYSAPTLYFLDGTWIPDQDLEAGEEGYFTLGPLNLPSGYYNVKVVTVRGTTFGAKLMA